jgi:hypothetical protein
VTIALLIASVWSGQAVGATPGAASTTPTATVTGQVTVNGAPFTGGRLPFGSLVDVTRGSVTIKTSVGTFRTAGTGHVTAAYVLLPTRVDGEPYVELRLAKGNFGVCPTQKGGVKSSSKKVVRALWGNGKGNFETVGRFAAAVVRGTHWLTDDRCDGTWTHVVVGTVDMIDLRTGKTVAVPHGHTYLVYSP